MTANSEQANTASKGVNTGTTAPTTANTTTIEVTSYAENYHGCSTFMPFSAANFSDGQA
jgi:hypothetical protein